MKAFFCVIFVSALLIGCSTARPTKSSSKVEKNLSGQPVYTKA
jgi:hypothetical protein